MTKFCIDSYLQAEASHPKLAGHREGPQEVQKLYQYRRRLWHQLHLFL